MEEIIVDELKKFFNECIDNLNHMYDLKSQNAQIRQYRSVELRPAEFTKEIQMRVNKKNDEYNKLKNDIQGEISLAACRGLGGCNFEVGYSVKNLDMVKMLCKELKELGYNAGYKVNNNKIELIIAW